jgi:hypothetical protein
LIVCGKPDSFKRSSSFKQRNIISSLIRRLQPEADLAVSFVLLNLVLATARISSL